MVYLCPYKFLVNLQTSLQITGLDFNEFKGEANRIPKVPKNITKYCCFQITTYNYTYCTNSIANLCSEYYKDTREMIRRRRKTSHSIHTLMNLFCLVNNSNVKSNDLE